MQNKFGMRAFGATVFMLAGLMGTAEAGCSLSFTSPRHGAKVGTPNITVFGSGGGDSATGDLGTVSATLNGTSFFSYSGSFTAAVNFLESRGVPVTLRAGANYLSVSGSVGGCSASDSMTVYYETSDVIPQKNKGDGSDRDGPPTCAGNPINFAMGNKVQEEVDYRSASAAYPLHFSRIFNSADGYWRHNYAMRLRVEAGTVTLIFANGRESPFARNGSTVTADPDELGSLSQNAANWLYVDRDGTQHVFDSTGRLVKQTLPQGHSQSLNYAADGTVTVTDSLGNSMRFTQDSHFQPTTFSADGVSVVYDYDNTFRLLAAVKTTGTEHSSRTYHYENASYPRFLTGVTDELGIRFSTFAYDTLGRGTSTAHAGGVEQTQVAYNADGTTTVTNAFGKQTVYHYVVVNGVKRIARIQGEPTPACPASNSTFTYTPRGQLASQIDNEGSVTNHAYNARGLEASRTEAAGTPHERTITTEWDHARPRPTLVTENGRTTAYNYDERGNLVTRTITDTATGQAKAWWWAYNAQGLVASDTAPNGAETRYEYDTYGNLVKTINGMGHITQFAYDGANRVASTTAPNGLVTTFTYDLRDRLLTRTVGGQQTTTLTYNPTGTLATLALPTGLALSYTYDAAHRRTGWSNNRGESGAFTLDGMGNRTTERTLDSSGAVAWAVVRTVDGLNRLISKTEGANQVNTFAYDLNDELSSETNGLNQSTRYARDGLRRVVAVTNAASAIATLGRNELDDVTQAKDFKGVATHYARDALGNATSEASADTGSRGTQYDGLGLPSQIVDALGQATQIQRDALGRPTSLSFADGKTTTLRYDLTASSIGYLSEIVDRSGTTEFTRDSFGRVVLKRQILASGMAQQVGYGYAANGLPTTLTYPSGNVLGYVYDATGRLTQLTWNGAPLVTGLTWNPLGQPQAWSWAFTAPSVHASRSYDTAGRLTATEFSSYVYDAAGRITNLSQQLWQPADADPTRVTIASTNMNWNVSYDAVGRIAGFNADGSNASFGYDANGNRASSTRTLGTQTTSRAYAVAAGSNQLTGFTQSMGGTTTSVAYAYNANGDLVSDGLRSYSYNAEGRLSAATTGAMDMSPTTRYAHNALGQRVFKTEPQYPTAEGDESDPGFFQGLVSFFAQFWAPSAADADLLGDVYIYDEEGNLLAETGTGGAYSVGLTQHIYLPTASGPMPIAVVINDAKFAVQSDHLNTPRRLVNESGQPVWQWAYSAFGDEQPTTASNRFAAPGTGPVLGTPATYNLRYPGQFYDKESGLSYNYFRSYDPRGGRYTQPDPIGLDGGWNRFGYVEGNPLSFTDPLGLQTTVDAAIRNALGRGDIAELETLLEAANPSQAAAIRSGVEKFGSRATDWIAKNCRGSINREFPGELRDKTLKEIMDQSKAGDSVAKKAWKLLNDNRFKK